LNDQHRLVEQLLFVVLVLGAVSAICVGIGSWWVAGQSLRPAYQAWEHQLTFISNASHELRTPLTLLRSSTEVVLRELPEANTDHRALLSDVVAECDHMSRLVDDLLLLSRLDARRLPLELSAVDAPELLADVARQMGRLATERGVELVVSCTDGTIWADRTRTRQVLLILLDNALRHTPSMGTIVLGAHPHGKQIGIEVADTGEGIAPEHLPRLWERFYRPDPARTDGGSGLGLSIAQALVTAQHGTITMTSTVGRGTQVRVVLPAVEPRHIGRHDRNAQEKRIHDGKTLG
jgi:signal transduction histidine kinase